MRASALKAIAAGLAAWCTCAGVRADQAGFFEVRVHLRVDRAIGSTAIPAILKDETESLWRPYGVQIEWEEAPSGDVATDAFSVEAIVDRHFDGPTPSNRPAVLGQASVPYDAPGARPIHVSYDAIERLLSFRTSVRGPVVSSVHQHDLARALGRVLAHEIGHVLLSVPNHDGRGLMRAAFLPEELGSPDSTPFRLTADGVGRLRSRIQVLTGAAEERDGRRRTEMGGEPIGRGIMAQTQTSR